MTYKWVFIYNLKPNNTENNTKISPIEAVQFIAELFPLTIITPPEPPPPLLSSPPPVPKIK